MHNAVGVGAPDDPDEIGSNTFVLFADINEEYEK